MSAQYSSVEPYRPSPGEKHELPGKTRGTFMGSGWNRHASSPKHLSRSPKK